MAPNRVIDFALRGARVGRGRAAAAVAHPAPTDPRMWRPSALKAPDPVSHAYSVTRSQVHEPHRSLELSERLDRWVARELITAEQADRILADEQRDAAVAPAAQRGPSMVGEALGYVGGVLVLVAAGVITARYWAGLGVAGRLSIVFGAAAVLLAAGAAVRARSGTDPQQAGPGQRLRSVCWLLSTAALATGLSLLGDEILHLSEDDQALLVGAGTACCAAVLWRVHRAILQHAALVVSLAGTAGAAAAHLPVADEKVIGLAVWGVGAVWLLLGWGAVIGPRQASYLIGGVVAVAGAVLTVSVDWGAALGLATAAVLIAAGAWMRDLVLLGVGAVATLLTVPPALGLYFPDSLAAPLALLVVGVLLVGGALYLMRRRRLTSGSALHSGSPRTAVGLAAVVAVVLTAFVVGLGLR